MSTTPPCPMRCVRNPVRYSAHLSGRKNTPAAASATPCAMAHTSADARTRLTRSRSRTTCARASSGVGRLTLLHRPQLLEAQDGTAVTCAVAAGRGPDNQFRCRWASRSFRGGIGPERRCRTSSIRRRRVTSSGRVPSACWSMIAGWRAGPARVYPGLRIDLSSSNGMTAEIREGR